MVIILVEVENVSLNSQVAFPMLREYVTDVNLTTTLQGDLNVLLRSPDASILKENVMIAQPHSFTLDKMNAWSKDVQCITSKAVKNAVPHTLNQMLEIALSKDAIKSKTENA